MSTILKFKKVQNSAGIHRETTWSFSCHSWMFRTKYEIVTAGSEVMWILQRKG